MKGSCLCGKCVFEIKGDPGPINKCHCTKCRKVSGTASNAVFWVEHDRMDWLTGQNQIKTFRVPNGLQSIFCSECGSPLPRLIPDEEWIVPAGLMDENPDVTILQHMWVEENPSWEIIGDDAPRYQQAPTR